MTTFPTRPLVAILAALALWTARPGEARAQCAGDCNGDTMVAINELIIGVNIALGSSPVSACASFDGNSDGMVAINELIAAVNNALNGCSPAATPTATPTQGEPTVTVTPRPGMCGDGSNCGDGFPDVTGQRGQLETCDDGNVVDDDGCPANCCVERCEPSAARTRVAINFATVDPQVFLLNVDLFLRYPDGVIDVPGADNDSAVLAALTSDIFALSPRDFNYGMRLLAEDPTFVGYNEGTVAVVEFLVCAGQQAPPIDSLSCQIRNGTDANFASVPAEQITCSLALVP
jgi:hypothetical protein